MFKSLFAEMEIPLMMLSGISLAVQQSFTRLGYLYYWYPGLLWTDLLEYPLNEHFTPWGSEDQNRLCCPKDHGLCWAVFVHLNQARNWKIRVRLFVRTRTVFSKIGEIKKFLAENSLMAIFSRYRLQNVH